VQPSHDLPPVYAETFDDVAGPVDDGDDDVRIDEVEPEPVSTSSSRSTGPGFPSTADVRTPHDDVDVPEPRTTDDDESDRPSPNARPGRLAARISSRR
jgi:hypothetical protein